MAKRGSIEFLRNPYFWCIATRLAIAMFPRVVQGDAADFEIMARNIADGHGLSRCWLEPFPSTSQRPPLLPLIMGVLYWLGVGQEIVPFIINVCCDLISIKLVRKWTKGLGLKSEKLAPWVIVGCPLLIAYSNAATTENLSITLLLAAALFFVRKQWLVSGLFWGLLALCRSYYLLFPGLLALLMLSGQLKIFSNRGRSAWGPIFILLGTSVLFPGAWVTRNWVAFNKVTFSQGGTSGYQMYSGLCINGFDWWKKSDVDTYFSVPEIYEVVRSHCKTDDEMAEINSRVMVKLRECLREKPVEVARNVITKQVLLLTHWGQLFPYYRVPFVIIGLIDAGLFMFWITAIYLLWKNRSVLSRRTYQRDALFFSGANILYVFLITLPFGVDARYLLGPLLLFMLAIYPLWVRKKTPGRSS